MRTLRRLAQLLVFLAFTFLFLNTEYQGTDIIPYAVNVFLRLDPLVAGAAIVAGRAMIALLWPALLVVVLTILMGRFFCGWVCPLGTVLDFVRAAFFGRRQAVKSAIPASWSKAKYFILFFLAVSSLFSLQLVFLFDPISLLIRSLAVSIFPAANFSLNALFGALYLTGVPAVTKISEPVFGFLKNHFLAFEQPHFRQAGFCGLLFLAILALEGLQPRFWCRNLCPLGALFGILGRFGLFRRRVTEPDCTSCGLCARRCRMGAVAEDFRTTAAGECVECLDCQALCPEQAVRFLGPAAVRSAPLDLSRRAVVTSIVFGAIAVPLSRAGAQAKAPDPALIRPPGALKEDEFLGRCTRCGECMRVCIANGLQPTFFQAGLAGLWSPVLVPRLGYCEFNCTLCGQVCPTGAIRRLPVPEKQKIKIGLAEFDRNHCLPWKGDSNCLVCEEHCPVPEKAILLRDEEVITLTGERRTFKRPYLDEQRCIGCGICETKCPLPDRAAIIVTSRGESRAPEPLIPYKRPRS